MRFLIETATIFQYTVFVKKIKNLKCISKVAKQDFESELVEMAQVEGVRQGWPGEPQNHMTRSDQFIGLTPQSFSLRSLR